jgi:hypothetical protein
MVVSGLEPVALLVGPAIRVVSLVIYATLRFGQNVHWFKSILILFVLYVAAWSGGSKDTRGGASAGEQRNEKAGWDRQPACNRAACVFQKFQVPEVDGAAGVAPKAL